MNSVQSDNVHGNFILCEKRCAHSFNLKKLNYDLSSNFQGNNFLIYLQEGLVYAVEFSHRSGRDLINVAKKRTNIIPIIEDARHPHKYRMLVGMVDTIFADVAQPDQARIVALNAQYFLKNGGHFVISIKVSIQKLKYIFSKIILNKWSMNRETTGNFSCVDEF